MTVMAWVRLIRLGGSTALFGALVLLSIECRRAQPNRVRESLSPPDASAVLGPRLHSAISIRLDTDQGKIRCTLDPDRAPNGVALFVGLATGRARHRDPKTGQVLATPLYAGRKFFRAIPGVMVQSGCPLDNGTGHPGYRIAVEAKPDDAERLRVPGALVLARYTPPPNRVDPMAPRSDQVLGSQFAVTLTDMRHLAGSVTVLGRCDELEVVTKIAEERARGASPELRAVVVENLALP